MRIRTHLKATSAALALLATGLFAAPAQAQTFTSDVIVQGSLCAGFDCITGESFGFDTLRLKENNLRIHFNDTSASASFPAADWRIVANDTSNGGGNYLAFEDSDGGTQPFRVDQGAGANALRVDSSGRVGIGEGSPVTELHIADGDTPTVRLEQDGSSGFTPQTWDVAGNETNFFIRDATNGSTLPFKIRPSAPTNSLYVNTDGNIGFGTQSPSAPLDIVGAGSQFVELNDTTSGTTWNYANIASEARIVSPQGPGVEFKMDTAGNVTILGDMSSKLSKLSNNGSVFTELADTSTGTTWNFANIANEARIISPQGAGVEFKMTTGGNVTITGTLTQGSDVNNKTAIVPVDNSEILQKVSALPVSSWSYKTDAADGVRHIGPMAQDFYAAFGTGASETGISAIDTGGVALAAIQALTAENTELKARLDALERKISEH